ncbi:MAG: hypothetical protein ABSE15_09165 [Candidatus Bathyarchaeia archaeon]
MVKVSSATGPQDERKIIKVGLIQTDLSADIADNVRRAESKKHRDTVLKSSAYQNFTEHDIFPKKKSKTLAT